MTTMAMANGNSNDDNDDDDIDNNYDNNYDKDSNWNGDDVDGNYVDDEIEDEDNDIVNSDVNISSCKKICIDKAINFIIDSRGRFYWRGKMIYITVINI